MVLEIATLISISSWLGNKLLDKGFDSVYNKITSQNFNNKFYEKVEIAAERMQVTHPDSFGGNIGYFFKHEEVFSELLKLLFLNSKVDVSIIEEKFEIDTLPKDFVFDFINILREELYLDEVLNEVLSSKEIFLATIDLSKTASEIKELSTLSLLEIKEVKKQF